MQETRSCRSLSRDIRMRITSNPVSLVDVKGDSNAAFRLECDKIVIFFTREYTALGMIPLFTIFVTTKIINLLH
jgi:hypothetical protein